jgi:glucose/arabinose dehydrogenase
MRALRRIVVMARAVALTATAIALTATATAAAQVSLVAVGTFAAPVYVAAPLGDTSRVFVVERGGTVRLIRDGVTQAAPFLDLGALSTLGERGLLSMAFAPDYATTGLFYVFFTASDTGALTIQERRRDAADPDRADAAYARTLLTIPHDQQSNHNGGQLQFGPDGMLYVSTGDGGSGGDPAQNGQNLDSRTPAVVNAVNHDPLLGKLLRLDPATGAGPASNPFPPPASEVWAYGLRNPWRFSFDRATGDLVVADVGQAAFEEVNLVPAASGFGRGANFGWSRFEGLHTYPGGAEVAPASEPGITFPVIEQSHAAGWCSITGGYVVRDPALPELQGEYVFGDFCRGELNAAALGASSPRLLGLTVPSLSGFGEDGCGRVYATSLNGPVYRLSSTGACSGPAPFAPGLAPAATPAPAGAAAAAAGPAAAAPAPGAAADTRAPRLRVRVAARQRVLRTRSVRLRLRCDEACGVRVTGAAVIRRLRATAAAAPPLRTTTVQRTLRAGREVALRVRVAPRTAVRLRRALRRPRRAVTMRLAITATDPARNAARRTVRVRVVP